MSKQKTLSATALKAKAKEVFEANTDAKNLYYTEDGNFWLPKAKGLAHYHSRQSGFKVQEMTRESLSEKAAKEPAKTPDPAKVEKTTAKAQKSGAEDAKTETGESAGESQETAQKAENGTGKNTEAAPAPVDVSAMTIKQIEEWIPGKDLATLEAALATVDTKGGKEALEAAIANLKAE